MSQTINKASVIGKLADLTVKEGMGKSGPYISLDGNVECRGEQAYHVPFRLFATAKAKDGSDNKSYYDAKKWAEQAITLADIAHGRNGEPTLVNMFGAYDTGDYYSRRDDAMKMFPHIRIFNPESRFSNGEEEGYFITFEGYIEEVNDDQEADVVHVQVYGIDYFGNAVPYSFDVPSEFRAQFLMGYGVGQTSTFAITYEVEELPGNDAPAGLGVMHITGGRKRLRPMLTGALSPKMSGEVGALTPDEIHEARTTKAQHLEEIKDRALSYSGNSMPQGNNAMASARLAW